MTNTTNISLRLPPALAILLNQAAAEDGQSRHAFILHTLHNAVARNNDHDLDLLIGFIPLISTEINPTDTECPECGGPLERPHLGILAGGRRPILFGPVCHICATANLVAGATLGPNILTEPSQGFS